jgi:hypothetical protein
MTITYSHHHSFDIHLAAEYGIEESIIIHHFQHWVRINKKLNRHFLDGRTWTYQTLDEIAANFPYLNKFKVLRIISKLIKRGVLKKANFNVKHYDRTIWYAFSNEEKFVPSIDILQKCNMEIAKTQHGYCENATPIPDTKPYTKEEEREGASPQASPVPPRPSASSEFKFKSKISGMTRIKMKSDKHEKLVSDFGKERVADMLERLDEYADINEKKFKQYSCHAAVLRKWLREDNSKMPKIRVTTDLELINKLKTYKHLISKGDMILGHDYVEFPRVHGENSYKVGEPGFKEKIHSRFRKMNIPLDI